jgi:pyruvate/2-oxoglutarate dehydrogenase complex dihydrolipoamide acyltransferase (E2) component
VKDVHIPKMGMSTVEVDVLRVLVREGQRVDAGDVVVEIESEKANYEIEAEIGGTVAEVLVSEGDVREVGDVVVRIEEDAA